MKFTFGCDPEFMLEMDGQLRSAIALLPRKDKAAKRPGGEVYYDNVLAELAVRPGRSKEEVLENIEDSLKSLVRMVRPAKVVARASAKYPASELGHKDAKIAGCNPEWDVYSLRCVLPPDEAFQTSLFRTAGGHVHVGADMLSDPLVGFDVIRMMDLFIGVPSLFLDHDPTSKERRKLYGHAGSHRATDYGFEYRTLGNFWLCCPEYVSLIYDLTAFCLDFVAEERHKKFWSLNESLLDSEDPSKAYSCSGYDLKMLRRAINSCDKKLGEKFMLFISNYLPESLYDRIDKLSHLPSNPDLQETWGLWKLTEG